MMKEILGKLRCDILFGKKRFVRANCYSFLFCQSGIKINSHLGIVNLKQMISAQIVLLASVGPGTEIAEDFLQIPLLGEDGARDQEAEVAQDPYLLNIVAEEERHLRTTDVGGTDHLQDPLFVPGPDH